MKHNDSELIKRVLTGDDDAFSVLVTKYQKHVHALAWRIVGDFHIAEEITQDSFLLAYKELKKLKEPQRFAGWLSVIARRCCFAWLRKKRVWTESYEHLEESDSEPIEITLYSEYVVEEKKRTAVEEQQYVVKKLLAKLQESERTVMTLHYFGEMTCVEIGEFLGVSANTVKSRLHRAQQRLKKQEPMIREALEHYNISPSLTENIMQEIVNTKPITPSTGKPFVPWLAAASTFVLVLIMLGIGNNSNLALFQQPYSLDANSDVPVELVEAPVVEHVVFEADTRKLIGSIKSSHRNPVSKQQPDDVQLLSGEAGMKNNIENYPQWNLPKEAKMRLGKGGMDTIQFSPDGMQLAVGSRIGVWHYDVQTGEVISLTPNLHRSVVYSPDGRYIASAGGDPTSSFGGTPLEIGVVLWDVTKGSEVSINDELPAARVMRFSNDSKTLVFLSLSRQTIYRIDVETGETSTTNMDERPGYLHLEKYALTEDRIAIGSDEGSIELWDTTTGQKISTLRKFGKKVRLPDYLTETNHASALKFSPDGKKLATGNLDTTVQLWDTSTGEELIVFQKPIEGKSWKVARENGKTIVNNPMKNERNGQPFTLAFSPDGTVLACGSDDSTVKLWNTTTGELIVTLTGQLSTVFELTFSPDGNMLACGSSDGTVRFWHTKLRKALKTQIAGHMWIRTASMIKDSSKLVSVSDNGIISVWDLEKSHKTTSITKAMLEEPYFRGWYRVFELSPDGTKLGNHGRQSDPSKPNFNGRLLRLTDVNTGHDLVTFPSSTLSKFSPDGKTVASGNGNKIRMLNIETGEKREIISFDLDDDSEEYQPRISKLAFSQDGERIISGTRGGYVQLWDVETGMELSSFFEDIPPIGNRHKETIQNFAFSSDGSLIAVGTTKRIRMIGRANQPHFKEKTFDSLGSSHTFIFSPDDTILIVCFYGGNIELWDVPTGDLLTTLDGHTVSVRDLSFSHDNKTLISIGGGTILFWDWEKIIANARAEEIKDPDEVNFTSEEQTNETVLQFQEHSPQKPKTSDRILTKGEIYLANEWYDEAYQEFMKNISAADYRGDQNVTTSPSFQRNLFSNIGNIGKNVQDKDGFIEMMKKLIDSFPDSPSIQLNAHLMWTEFYNECGMPDISGQHLQKIHYIIAEIPKERPTLQIDANLIIAEYYFENEIIDKAVEHLQNIDKITRNLTPKQSNIKVNANFAMAAFYRKYDLIEEADELINNTGFVTEDAWMVLGPFDNAGGIGFDTAYIPEDLTQIDIDAKFDGLDGKVSWQKCPDDLLDGIVRFWENTDWSVGYAFATVVSPDDRDVQFRFDSDDQGKVWLNGKEVFTHTKSFKVEFDRYMFPVKLKKGINSILVKVCEEEGGWAFILRITDQDGQAFDDLKINRVDQY
ncbi:MAG: sigma-70 family RNA polymerase sigma factor [Candidatus Poribacteria bacterium]|nr:sigma-70 family RNA polymerase sigma factor [Candidatus Poribacteria bacterium]